FKIRGFDVSEGFFRDGIPTGTFAPLSANDLERVEVLKGPASILFGQGEPGGIINLVTKKPLDEPFYSASFSAGNFDTYEGAIDLSGPLNESKTVKYRLNVSYENYESFRDFVNGERFLVSPTLAWDIGENTSISFYGQYVSDQETSDNGIPAQGDGIVDVPRERFLDEDFGEFEQEQFRVGYRLDHQFDNTWSVRHTLEYNEFEPRRFGVLFDEFDETTGELTRLEYGTDERFQRFFTNVDAIAEFNTGSIEHQVLFGVEYLSNVDRQAFEFSDPFPSINVFNPVYSNNPFEIETNFFRDDNVDSVGVYLQDQVDLLPNLIVLAGVRFDYVDQFRTVQNLGEERAEFEQDDSDFTPRFGLVYKPIEPVSVYASYTTSFNPSFGTSRNADDSTFDPETGRQFEVGVKTDISEQLSFTFAAFDIRKQNVRTTDPDDPLFSVQTGEQASRGIELSVNGEILPGWNITTGYTYLDAFVSEDNTDIVDNQLPNVPDNQFSLWTTYDIQRGSLEGLGFGLGFLFVDDRFGDLDNTFTLPSYFRTDAALFYKRNNWRTQLNIENLFDIEYFPSTNFDSRLGVNPGAPFTILGTIAVEF
ncbi:MAG: TonB-dependent siderophore receptor, partial [Cyanobacteria bacterium J06635_13]